MSVEEELERLQEQVAAAQKQVAAAQAAAQEEIERLRRRGRKCRGTVRQQQEEIERLRKVVKRLEEQFPRFQNLMGHVYRDPHEEENERLRQEVKRLEDGLRHCRDAAAEVEKLLTDTQRARLKELRK
jgi:archaellum component FlaC